nr:DNA/RNA non-specific endonuclease [Burkholderia ambifaria]
MRKYLAGLLIAVASHAFASDSCSQLSPQGEPPVLVNPRMAAKTRLLCYSDFEVLHSGITHGPLWSAEHLTRAHLVAAKDEVRTNRFFEERRLPDGEGARLADYRKSGYDRGHMSPAGDRWNDEAMAESFSLANMVPQNPTNNRRLWAHIEEAVRRIGMSAADTYVVTGPMFKGAELKTIGATGVIVPTQIFKVVYVPTQRLAFAIVVNNTAANRYEIATVHELEAQSGLRFPGIPESLKDTRIGGLNGVQGVRG